MRTHRTHQPRPDVPAERSIVAPNPTELIGEVAGLVGECVVHGRCFFVIEAPDQHRYVQGLVIDDELWLESVSDASLGHCCAEHCLTDEQVRVLVRLAWRPPTDGAPNWYRALAGTPSFARLAAELLVRTLLDVHAVPAGSRLSVLTGEAAGRPVRVAVA